VTGLTLAARLRDVERGQVAVTAPTSARLGSRVEASGVTDRHALLKRRIHVAIVERLGPILGQADVTDEDLARQVQAELQVVLDEDGTPLSVTERARLTEQVSAEVLGLGPLEPLLRDPSITEIMVNGPSTIYVERAGTLERVHASFVDEQHLRRIIDRVVAKVGRRCDESSPMVDARLADGSRVNAVIAPIAVDGSGLTIRKFAVDSYGIEDLISFGTLTTDAADVLAAAVKAAKTVLVSGGTGSGKTTTLNVLSSFISEAERIVTIEDAAELRLEQEHVFRLESRPQNMEGRGEVTIRDLVRNALRMRPDRIIVGEVRDGAALDMLQAMSTGHDGSLCTVHANGVRDALARIETMVLMAGVELPVQAIRAQIASAITLVVHQDRMHDGTRKITCIAEVCGMEGDKVTMQNIFELDGSGRLAATGIVPDCLSEIAERSGRIDRAMFAVDEFSRAQLKAGPRS